MGRGMTLKLADTRGSWVYVMPVSGMVLTSAVHEEFQVGRVTFLTVRRLARVRRRLGIPTRLSEMRSLHSLAPFLSDGQQVVAVVRHTGKPRDLDAQIQRMVAEALQILSVSQLGYAKRRFNAFPAIDGPHRTRTDHLCVNARTGAAIGSSQLRGKLGELVLDDPWVRYQKSVFFWKLRAILQGDQSVAGSWRETLRRVAVLVGQSQTSNDLAHAFLLNMIAIEALLTVQGDKYSDTLPERVEAFIGWIGFWHTHDYENRIRDAYKKRCRYVHDGDASAVEVADLLFLDDIVLNLLVNIVAHPALFGCKDDVIGFASRVSAERILGITGQNSKVRPKTLRHLARTYSDDDLRRI
jgi:Apea-like HEPN